MGFLDTLSGVMPIAGLLGGDERRDAMAHAQGQYGGQTDEALAQLGQQAAGRKSFAAEQLRQGLQQNVSGQQAMAASARPGQQAMAHRQAAQNAGRMGAELSGQQALARLAEQQMAQQQYAQLLLGLRGQNVQAQLGLAQQPTQRERAMGMGQAAASAMMMSDRTVKTAIADGDGDAERLLDGLRAYSYEYKDATHGKGKQLGVMAQDLERAGLSQAIIETPDGKAVHGAKLAGALAAASAQMHRRIKRLEGKE